MPHPENKASVFLLADEHMDGGSPEYIWLLSLSKTFSSTFPGSQKSGYYNRFGVLESRTTTFYWELE